MEPGGSGGWTQSLGSALPGPDSVAPSAPGPASTASVPIASGTPLVMRQTVNGEAPLGRNSQSCHAFELWGFPRAQSVSFLISALKFFQRVLKDSYYRGYWLHSCRTRCVYKESGDSKRKLCGPSAPLTPWTYSFRTQAVWLTRSWCSGHMSDLCLLGGRAEFRTLVDQRPPSPM